MAAYRRHRCRRHRRLVIALCPLLFFELILSVQRASFIYAESLYSIYLFHSHLTSKATIDYMAIYIKNFCYIIFIVLYILFCHSIMC